tara:strand:+ start:373 stop:822 length:450 start_codon:yes stop_codon:yes gene_type:complete
MKSQSLQINFVLLVLLFAMGGASVVFASANAGSVNYATTSVETENQEEMFKTQEVLTEVDQVGEGDMNDATAPEIFFIDVYTLNESETVFSLWIGGEYKNYRFKTGDVAEAALMLAEELKINADDLVSNSGGIYDQGALLAQLQQSDNK